MPYSNPQCSILHHTSDASNTDIAEPSQVELKSWGEEKEMAERRHRNYRLNSIDFNWYMAG